MEKSYAKRYKESLIANNCSARAEGGLAFLESEREKWICKKCGGAFSVHNRACSECGDMR